MTLPQFKKKNGLKLDKQKKKVVLYVTFWLKN